MNQPRFTIEDVPLERIIDLRWRILRAGLDRSTAVFTGDELLTTRHFAAICDAHAIGCASILLSEWRKEPAWQLRGMAVDESLQGKGVGRAILLAVEQFVLGQSHPRLLWCNARLTALGFYSGMGWEIVGDRFDIPTAGPHYKMIRRL